MGLAGARGLRGRMVSRRVPWHRSRGLSSWVMTTLVIGGHGDQVDPIAEAKARNATLAQFFLGDPQAWKGPEFAYAGGAAGLKAAAAEAGIALYVHPPDVPNVP